MRSAINRHAWGLALRAYENYRIALTEAVRRGEVDAQSLAYLVPAEEWPRLVRSDPADEWIPF